MQNFTFVKPVNLRTVHSVTVLTLHLVEQYCELFVIYPTLLNEDNCPDISHKLF
jgi:hypothetical protein